MLKITTTADVSIDLGSAQIAELLKEIPEELLLDELNRRNKIDLF